MSILKKVVCWRDKKFQITNHKQITMTEIPNLKPVHNLRLRELQSCFGLWILEFVIYLRFGAWSLGFHKPYYSKNSSQFLPAKPFHL
jgi:hypothetical protein